MKSLAHRALGSLVALLGVFGSVSLHASSGGVVVSLSQATVSFSDQSYPALIGEHTRPGIFPLTHARVLARGYGGDVLAWGARPDGTPLAIHRVWTLSPKQRRIERIRGPVAGRQGITGGCVNVMPDVYQLLVDCCSNGTVVIVP